MNTLNSLSKKSGAKQASLLLKYFFGLYWSLFNVFSRLDDDSRVSISPGFPFWVPDQLSVHSQAFHFLVSSKAYGILAESCLYQIGHSGK
jgi:hypothetical protein